MDYGTGIVILVVVCALVVLYLNRDRVKGWIGGKQ